MATKAQALQLLMFLLVRIMKFGHHWELNPEPLAATTISWQTNTPILNLYGQWVLLCYNLALNRPTEIFFFSKIFLSVEFFTLLICHFTCCIL